MTERNAGEGAEPPAPLEVETDTVKDLDPQEGEGLMAPNAPTPYSSICCAVE